MSQEGKLKMIMKSLQSAKRSLYSSEKCTPIIIHVSKHILCLLLTPCCSMYINRILYYKRSSLSSSCMRHDLKCLKEKIWKHGTLRLCMCVLYIYVEIIPHDKILRMLHITQIWHSDMMKVSQPSHVVHWCL